MFRKKMFKRSNSRKFRGIKLCVFFSFIVSIVIFIDTTISQIIGPLAIKNAEELIVDKMNSIVSKTLSDMELTYDDLILSESQNGDLSYMQANSVVINKLKATIVKKTDEALDSNKNLVTSVQIGSVVNSALLSNKGPKIKIYFDLYCSSNSEIISSFSEAGLNQTLHSIKLLVTTEFCLVIINDQYFDKIVSDFIVAESVILGDVPTSYGSLYGLNT